ncbi:MAG: sigma-54-dependent Fis family transcriptional regulator [Erysipelotrichia bacterium]|nr:sigma-54-dependent Fis family transcriptional regulator [Erysipelotrichia bacterium]
MPRIADKNGRVPSVLIVDDEESVLYTLEAILKPEGYAVTRALCAEEAYALSLDACFDLVITDMTMPGDSGLVLLEKLIGKFPDLLVIMITAYGSEALAVDAMKKGAYDYLPKPFSNDELRLTVRRAIEKSRLRVENQLLREQLHQREGLATIIGSSECMQKVYDLIERVGPNDVTVLITGESGTGKELVANALHSLSPRKNKPFIRVNCAALPENLIESELFGYERGAFTGAINRRLGKFEIADSGTIFLDEIGEMSMATQTKILRILQEREFERIGGNQTISVDTRVITATNRDLIKGIDVGNFREDLFYRLNVINIHLPPLRERLGDIPAIVEFFSRKYCEKLNRKFNSFSDHFMGRLMQYNWPGNVRELQNLIEKVIILEDEDVFQADSSRFQMRAKLANEKFIEEGLMAMQYKEAKDVLLKTFERKYFEGLLEKTSGNMSEAARIAGMHRKNLYLKLKELNIAKE